MKSHALLCLLALASPLTAVIPPAIDLSGTWQCWLAPEDRPAELKSTARGDFHAIQLPGLITAQGLGEAPSMETKWTGDGWRHPWLFPEYQDRSQFKMPFFLQPPKHYLGAAFYQRVIEIPPSWQDLDASLFLERVHWQSQLWVDGLPAGEANSLGTRMSSTSASASLQENTPSRCSSITASHRSMWGP